MKEKYNDLLQYLKKMESIVIAYSGGVDSTLLLYSALKVLPSENVFPVIVNSQFIPNSEYADALNTANTLKTQVNVLNVDILCCSNIISNPENRCYFCKLELFNKIIEYQKTTAANFIIEGSNLDDMHDYRPGLKALAELDIKSPYKEVGLTKEEIRLLSKDAGLPTWNKPAASCLATRIPFNTPIKEEDLKSIEEAENHLHSLGFSQVRVRHHNSIARIEMPPEDFEKAIYMKENITLKLKNQGYSYVTLDLSGYTRGSLNIT